MIWASIVIPFAYIEWSFLNSFMKKLRLTYSSVLWFCLIASACVVLEFRLFVDTFAHLCVLAEGGIIGVDDS